MFEQLVYVVDVEGKKLSRWFGGKKRKNNSNLYKAISGILENVSG